jgi:hypothetical protein
MGWLTGAGRPETAPQVVGWHGPRRSLRPSELISAAQNPVKALSIAVLQHRMKYVIEE